MEKTVAQISELFAQFSKDAGLQIEKGNKTAPVPVRHRLNLKSFSNNSERNRWKHLQNKFSFVT